MLVTSRWPLVLAILTHDSYLLLFDVPKGGPAHKKQLHARTAEVIVGGLGGRGAEWVEGGEGGEDGRRGGGLKG